MSDLHEHAGRTFASPMPVHPGAAGSPPSAAQLARAASARLAAGERAVRLRHLEGAYAGLFVAELLAGPWETGRRPLVYVVPDDEAARRAADVLGFFLGEGTADKALLARPRVEVLATVEASPYGGLLPDRRALEARLATLFRLTQGIGGEVLVASAAALLRRVLPRQPFEARAEVLLPGSTLDREALLRSLVAMGYRRMPVCDDPGSFAMRGGVIDVFPPLYRFPARLELFGDEVESIKLFDPESQRSLRAVPELYLHPARETVPLEAEVEEARQRARRRALELGDQQGLPSSKVNALADDLASGTDFYGLEGLAPLLHERMATLFEYLPPDASLVVVDPLGVEAALLREEARHKKLLEARGADGELCVPYEQWFLTAEELLAELARRPRLEFVQLALDVAATADGGPDAASGDLSATVEPHTALATELRRVRAERGQELVAPLARQLRSWLDEGLQPVVVSRSLPQGERAASLLRGYALPVKTIEAPWPLGPARQPSGVVEIRRGDLARGFLAPGDRLAIVSEEEVFGPKARRGATSRAATPAAGASSAAASYASFVASLGELRPGDLVVHQEHGIGRYQGLVTLEVPSAPPQAGGDVTDRRFGRRGNIRADFLHLEYADGAKLYLPVYRLNLIEKYVGSGEQAGLVPRLDKLGGATWEKTKRKVSQAVKQMADELLRLYAERQLARGFAFPTAEELGSLWTEFEATFPYEETPDQRRAIDEVLADMEKDRPMDRLVCGDVGYGKTEVAIRAALRAVLARKQVAVLAPTTVLVEQHAVTFAERFKDFPVNVGSLSRFQSKKEQAEVLKKLREGKLDVVIGTHRLLSTDVEFKDLGLLVIDEEQRFGVAHKERLKKMRTEVDVLTMSATPIPRTLHMAMLGARDLSIITTPPADRVAVRTFVTRDSDQTVREAIEKELARGGQVFFVCPRVKGRVRAQAKGASAEVPEVDDQASIVREAERIRRLVPRAKVILAHGQMPEAELEKAMVEFVDGKADVLVCTTIVESGLDIPRANTMFVQRADAFGLAQLYQLRGRIGRGRERAYCYLLVPPEGAFTGEARQRLATLERFTELGAGFQIASHDLELRGAGNLLGAEQSGHIALVGFETYTRIMEEAVAELRGHELLREPEPELKFDLPGYIPDDYVDDVAQRLAFYQKLSRAVVSNGAAGAGTAADGTELEEAVAAVLGELTDRYGHPPPEVENLGEIMIAKGYAYRLRALSIDVAGDRLALTLSKSTRLSPESVIQLVSKKGSPYRLTQDLKLVRRLAATDPREKLLEVKKVLQELCSHVS